MPPASSGEALPLTNFRRSESVFTQKEKDRRVTAAEKRVQAAKDRAEAYELKAKAAREEAATETAGLEWLRAAPVPPTTTPKEV
jgi:hypothetical protein